MQKVIEIVLANLTQESRKRKFEDDAEIFSATELYSVDEINPKEESKQSVHMDVERPEVLNSRVRNASIDIHLLSDLRGLKNEDEKNMMYYAASYYCFGGDSASQKLEKKLKQKYAGIRADLVQTSDVQAVLATSSNSTTVMDFIR